MATGLRDADDIRRQMAQIRVEMHQDVRAVVAGAEAVTDWRRYVRFHPWASLVVAFTVGYFIVPRKRRSIREAVEAAATSTAAKVQELAGAPANGVVKAPAKERKRAGIFGTVVGFVAPLALRAAQSALGQYVEAMLAGQAMGTQAAAHAAPPPGATVRPPTNRPR